jgi:Bacterial Ig domain
VFESLQQWLNQKSKAARRPRGWQPRVEHLEERLAPADLALAYSTFLAGSTGTFIRGMTSNSAGDIYITGGTAGPGFPTTPGAYQTTFQGVAGGYPNAFVAELNPQGNIIWSTLFSAPGAGDSYAYAVAVDAAGDVYIGGRAAEGLPTTPGVIQPNYEGSYDYGHGRDDGFIAKFSPDGAHLLWDTYLAATTNIRSIAVNAAGDVYALTANASAPAAWFSNGAESTAPDAGSSFIIEISSDGTKVLAGTYTGAGGALALDASGDVYLGGYTSFTNLPTPNGYQQTYAGGTEEIYVAKFTPNLSTMIYGTYLGGASGDTNGSTHEITVDSQGDAIVAMNTTSPNMPVTPGAYDPTYQGGGSSDTSGDIYVAKLSANGSQLLAATYLGGAGGDYFADGPSVDAQGDVYVGLSTTSTNIPTTTDAVQRTNAGSDVYLAELSPDFTSLEYGTYLGGSTGASNNRSTLVTGNGDVYWAGDTTSRDFPTKNPLPGQSVYQGSDDAFLVKFLPTTPPSVTLSVNQTSYSAGSSITLDATAGDSAGAISQVAFYANNVLVGTSTGAPYTFTWNDVAAGGYSLTAVATNNLGATTTSNAIEVTVAGATNQPPVIVTPAFSNSNQVANSTTLGVVANDDGGTANLSYTWTVLSKPAGAAAPTFSANNGTTTGNNTSVTFSAAGTYTFQVTVRDQAGLSATSSVNVTVAQNATSIAISPANGSVVTNGTVQFTGVVTDQFGNPLAVQPPLIWEAGGGTITDAGLFTAGAAPGTYTVGVGTFRIFGTVYATLQVVAANNQPPTVVDPITATVSSNPAVYNVSVLGADPSGASNLIYTWSTIGTPDLGTAPPPAPVVFGANNGSNAGKNTTATFSAAGLYDLAVTIENPNTGLSVVATQDITVNPTFSVVVTPAAPTVADGGTQQFSAAVVDQFGNVSQPTFSWSLVSGVGSVSSTGLYTAPASGSGSATVQATFVGVGNNVNLSGTGTVTLTASAHSPPSVATPAAANPSPVNGTTTNLSVLGADAGGEASLTYTWTTIGTLPAAVTFSANGTNAAQNTTVTFGKAGTYSFQVTITDAEGLTATSTVNVTVNQTLTSIALTPASASLNDGATQQFSATALDQFGNALTTQPAFSWSVTGSGTISSSGLYSAPTSGTGAATVTANNGSVSATASVAVNAQGPTVQNAAAANPSPVNGTTTNLSVLGADAGGAASLTYTWATTGTPPAPVTFSANGTNAAQNSTVTIARAGTYSFQVTITDASGLTATSAVNVTVNQTFTRIALTPASASLGDGATQQFGATALDQFGNALITQPVFAWSVTGLGTINSSSGLYSAPTSGTGTATVTASSGSVRGTAGVTIMAPPAAETWTGLGATNNWSEAANWSADAVPGAGTTVIFNGTSSKNALVDSGFAGTVAAVQINAGYTGTVSLNENLTVQGAFSEASGTFNAGADTLFVAGNFTYTAGVFNAGTGTVTFDQSNSSASTVTVSAAGVNFNNVTIAQSNPSAGVNQLAIAGTLSVDGTFIYGGASLTAISSGTIACAGNVDVQKTAGTGFTGTQTILLDGTGNQTVSDSADPAVGGMVRAVTINKPSGTVTLTSNLVTGTLILTAGTVNTGSYAWLCTNLTDTSGGNLGNVTLEGGALVNSANLLVNNLTFTAGATLTAPTGNLYVSGNWNNSAGGTFNANGGTVVFDGTGGTQLLTSGGSAFNNLTISAGSSVQLQDNLTVIDVLANLGTLNPNGHTVTIG